MQKLELLNLTKLDVVRHFLKTYLFAIRLNDLYKIWMMNMLDSSSSIKNGIRGGNNCEPQKESWLNHRTLISVTAYTEL